MPIVLQLLVVVGRLVLVVLLTYDPLSRPRRIAIATAVVEILSLVHAVMVLRGP